MSTGTALVESFKKELDMRMEKVYRNLLPNNLDPQKFADTAFFIISSKPEYLDATKYCRKSLFRSLATFATLGLMPNPVNRQGALVTFYIGKRKIFEFVPIPEYMGLITIAKRNSDVVNVTAQCVYSNDNVEIILGDSPSVVHKPELLRDRGEVIGAYAIVTYKDGFKDVEWMNNDQIMQVAAKSKAQSGPWHGTEQDIHEMKRKTVIRRICKRIPDAPLQNAIAAHDQMESGTKVYAEEDGSMVYEADAIVTGHEDNSYDVNDMMNGKKPPNNKNKGAKPRSAKKQETETETVPVDDTPPAPTDDDAPCG